MGIFLDEPKYEVIDRTPGFGKTVRNFNLDDTMKMVGLTGMSLPVGYLAGGSVNVRGPSMYCAGLIGLMGGFMFAYQCSAGRLIGMFPNEEDVRKHRH
ncbi:hypothetical protein CBR_g41406 [Chara braunii]|uniref:NADH-ubiquinone oxidoreductase 21kDa subunit N-terminal domain-containing protein n=1 Tax=Chara braunii TaxID=69332 RepID=A0A388LVQ4_CHABU|nr:hypothetical protein CBR_g41406 [Chara braunii]|eukprot:GBG86410.1 hypothetical protein CBR_g41406 [Chara braunii]